MATGGINYMWSTGSTSNSIIITNPGTYFVTATNSLGCSRSDSLVVTQLPLPTISITGDASICQGETVTLTATGASQYVWNTQDVGAVVSMTPQTTTVYTVTATNAQGCTNTASRTVAVQALPNVQISGTLTLCQGQTTTLTATGGFTYLWNNGSTSNSIQATEDGNYTVVATAANGCSNSQTVTLTVHPVPVMSITGNTTLCANETETLTATGAASLSPYYSYTLDDATKKSALSKLGSKFGAPALMSSLAYATMLSAMRSGEQLTAEQAFIITGIDVTKVEASPKVSISSFSLADGITLAVDPSATVDGEEVSSTAPLTIKVYVTLSVQYTDNLASATWTEAARKTMQLTLASGERKIGADELTDVNDALREAVAEHGSGCYFRVVVEVGEK